MMKKSVSVNFKIRRVSAFLGICLILTAFYQITEISKESERSAASYEKLEQKAVVFQKKDVKIDFHLLHQTNEDIVAWILFDNNKISYPIVQGKDNEEYLYQTADKKKNPAGSIFIDALCSADFTDSHTIIYGHNMKDQSMFGSLKNYNLKEDYFQENRYFTIYTPEKTLRYEIFAWYEAAADDDVYQIGFAADELFAEFVEQILARRVYDTNVTAGREDRIVTLSTCSANGKRFVVHGKWKHN